MATENTQPQPDFETQTEIKKKFGTQRKFSQISGIPEVALSNYLRGVKPWKPEHAKKAVSRSHLVAYFDT